MKSLVLILFLCSPFISFGQQYKQLFNGKDLSGWKIHGTEKWYVENGEIIGESGPDEGFGYLSTDSSYKNFILDTHFFLEKQGNSGVFFRSSIEGVIINGWQVEVQGPNTGGIYESYARGWLCQPPEKLRGMLKPNAWNYLRIYAYGERVTVWLNGRQMCEINDKQVGAGDGFIALQIHHDGGVKVRWKDIRIKVLK